MVNSLQDEATRTRHFINADRRLLNRIVDRVEHLTGMVNRSHIWDNHQSVVEDMNGYLVQLENRHNEIQRILNIYKLQRIQLEAGKLSEHILQ